MIIILTSFIPSPSKERGRDREEGLRSS